MTAVAAALLGLLAAGRARADSTGTTQPANGQLVFTVTSVSPRYAEPGYTITITGMLRNVSDAAMASLSVNVAGAHTPLSSMGAVQEFAAGTSVPSLTRLSIKPFRVPSLAAHAATTWAVKVPVSALGVSCFGVYPLAAQVSDATGAQIASSDMPLVFWPRNLHSCQTASRPRPAHIAWIWPLIDSPHQGPCQGVLLDNNLATSVRPGGRLSTLLTAASRYTAHGGALTWAIDPALLDSLALMRQPYQVGHAANCGHAAQYPASSAAATWLGSLIAATARQTVFMTPYADVDMAALFRHGSDADLGHAFTDGQQIARRVLGRDPAPAPLPVTGRKIAAMAWPAGGVASVGMLGYLTAVQKINTVILAQPASALPYAPGAYTKVPTGAGLPVNVLQANDYLSALLKSRAASSRQPAAIARVSQLYLAETAMNIAENPSISRPIVVTPPRHWNPAGSLCENLLTDTAAAPWLAPSNASRLVTLPPQRASGPVSQSRPGVELSRRLLSKVNLLSKRLRLLESILVNADPTLRHAVFGVESSWWRSRGGSSRARTMLMRTSQFVGYQFSQLSLGGNKYVTLGGRSGSVIVSVRNGLSYPVSVDLRVTVTNINGNVSVTPPPPILVQPGKVAEPKLAVHATQNGQAVLHFILISPNGAALPHGRLTMQVRASNFGRIALIICAAALAVFVLASAGRAIRHGRPAPPEPAPDAPQALPGSQDPASHRAEPDNVVLDRSELTPAGPAAVDRRPSVPGRRPMEERR